jgi:hypothetical protein
MGILSLPLAHGQSLDKSWRESVPLHLSTSEVYDLLATRVGEYDATFELPNEIVEFPNAGSGSCDPPLMDSWRAIHYIVLGIRVVPKNQVAFQSRSSVGVRYTVENQTQECVLGIDYFATSEDRYLNRSAPRQNASTPIFEQYGLVSAEQENAILDNFAIQLLNDRELTGRVILRRGQYSPKFAAKKLLRIKKYLLKQRRVPANRISAFELHRGKDFTVELYLLPKAKAGSGQDQDLQ